MDKVERLHPLLPGVGQAEPTHTGSSTLAMEGSTTVTSPTEGSSSRRVNPFGTPGDEPPENPFSTPVAATPIAESLTSRRSPHTRNASTYEGRRARVVKHWLVANVVQSLALADASRVVGSRANSRSHGSKSPRRKSTGTASSFTHASLSDLVSWHDQQHPLGQIIDNISLRYWWIPLLEGNSGHPQL